MMATGTLEKCDILRLIQVSTVPGRWRVWRRVGERFVYVNFVNRVTHSGGGVMVWAVISYGHCTQLRFIDWQFECTEIP